MTFEDWSKTDAAKDYVGFHVAYVPGLGIVGFDRDLSALAIRVRTHNQANSLLFGYIPGSTARVSEALDEELGQIIFRLETNFSTFVKRVLELPGADVVKVSILNDLEKAKEFKQKLR